MSLLVAQAADWWKSPWGGQRMDLHWLCLPVLEDTQCCVPLRCSEEKHDKELYRGLLHFTVRWGGARGGAVGTAGRNNPPLSFLLPVTTWELLLMVSAVKKVFKVGSQPFLRFQSYWHGYMELQPPAGAHPSSKIQESAFHICLNWGEPIALL